MVLVGSDVLQVNLLIVRVLEAHDRQCAYDRPSNSNLLVLLMKTNYFQEREVLQDETKMPVLLDMATSKCGVLYFRLGLHRKTRRESG